MMTKENKEIYNLDSSCHSGFPRAWLMDKIKEEQGENGLVLDDTTMTIGKRTHKPTTTKLV